MKQTMVLLWNKDNNIMYIPKIYKIWETGELKSEHN